MSEADKVPKEIEKLTRRQFLPIIGPTKGKVLAYIICDTRPKRVLEVGTLISYSAILMNKYIDADAVLTTIEIHEEEAEMVFLDADKSEYIDYLRLVEANLHQGSVIVADNAGIFAAEVKDYPEYVRSSGEYKSEYHPLGETELKWAGNCDRIALTSEMSIVDKPNAFRSILSFYITRALVRMQANIGRIGDRVDGLCKLL